MRFFLIGFLLLISVFSPASAARLVMVESDGCSWCELWNEEVGAIYGLTTEGKMAPLVRYDIDDIDDIPATTYVLDKAVHFTPTFIVLEDRKEVGRITGYPGESFFWGMLEQILDRIPGQSKTAGVN